MNIFFEMHSNLPQQAPGSKTSTLKALAAIPKPRSEAQILDVGCGPGRQTVLLAQETGCDITAIDTHQPFLDEVRQRAAEADVSDIIHTVNCPMEAMEFENGRFDIIWSEGAIYIMGFRDGLVAWRRFLKPGGFIAVTELTWLTDSPPEEARLFWAEDYPAMSSVDANLDMIRESGYELVSHFTLPESDWWTGYYRPLEKRIEALRSLYASDKAALDVFESTNREIDIYRKYASSYGYVFYVMKAI